MGDSKSKTARIRQILDRLMKTQSDGDAFDPEKIIAAHPELMPELGEELKKFAAIEPGLRGLDLDETRTTGAVAVRGTGSLTGALHAVGVVLHRPDLHEEMAALKPRGGLSPC